MWKVGGIKIERTRARNFVLQTDKEICEKQKLFVNSITENFQRENFSGRGLSEPPRTQLSEYL